jgi:hypothetical protein
MQLVDPVALSAASVRAAVSTSADSELPVTRDFGRVDEAREAWDAVENQLIAWALDPTEFDDEGVPPPARATIQTAVQVAAILCKCGYPAPTRVVPDAHGGIVFELQIKDTFESLHVGASGTMDHRLFKNMRLVARESWLLTPKDPT